MSSPVGKIIGLVSKYNGQPLRYTVEDTPAHGFPVFSPGESTSSYLSPYTKFEVVAATASSSYVHIRCVYNRKYWVRSTNDNFWIWAGADEINEDKNSWLCTLFEILDANDKPNYIRIRHVQLGCYLYLWTASAFYTYGLFAASPNVSDDERDVAEWEDSGSYYVLPKFISFKNPRLGTYLGAKIIDGLNHLQFSSQNIQDETVMHESFAKAWGGHTIQSSYFALYWETNADGFQSAWIVADRNDPNLSGNGCSFWVLDAGENNLVALRTYNENFYCKERSSGNKTNCLYALNTTTFDEAKLEVVETISARFIYGVEYRQSDARYYDKNRVFVAEQTLTNPNNQPMELPISFSYPSFSTSKTWNSTNSNKVFNNVSLDAQLPQIIPNAKSNITREYNWGEPITTTTETNATYSVTVPPNSSINVKFYATHTSADIPFVYSQDDTLLNGNKVTTQFDDGLFTVINYVDFTYEAA